MATTGDQELAVDSHGVLLAPVVAVTDLLPDHGPMPARAVLHLQHVHLGLLGLLNS
jgi:hypothetical protein